MIYFILTSIFFSSWISSSYGIYFLLNEGDRKCFYEDLPPDVMVTGIYNMLLWDDDNQLYLPANHYGAMIRVKGPDDENIMARGYRGEGRFVFTSSLEGEHVICFDTDGPLWYDGSKMKIHLELRKGLHDIKALQHQDTMTEMKMMVGLLLSQLDLISKEQQYQRNREADFRELSENTWYRVVVSCVTTPLLVVLIRLFQSYHLRNFFMAKKLV